MARALLIALLCFPLVSFGATVQGDRDVTLSEAPVGNTYLTGTNITVATATPADVLSAGANISIDAPVAGDLMLAGAQILVRGAVEGDMRAVGGRIDVSAPVKGDLMLAGGQIAVTATTADTRLAGGSVRHTGGSTGPVTIYGGDVYLSGAFAGDVTVMASDRLTLADDTVIGGVLRYNAPQQAVMPASIQDGGRVEYTGATYLPTAEEARTFALAGVGILLVVKALAALIAAGVVAGLFPALAQKVGDRTLSRPRTFFLYLLIGFGVLAATPLLLMLLIVSFVGIGLALLIGALYLLLLVLGYLYAAVIAGAALARTFGKRKKLSWRDALLGMLVLQVVGFIPMLGGFVVLVLMLAGMGALLMLFYGFAFPQSEPE